MQNRQTFKTPPSTGGPIFNVPSVVLGFVALCGLVYFAGTSSARFDDFIKGYLVFWPVRLTHGFEVDPTGEFFLGISGLFTSSFVHANFTHMAVNMIWFVIFGTPVARRIGAGRFLLFLLVCQFFGGMASVLYHYGTVTAHVGASVLTSALLAAAIQFAFRQSLGFGNEVVAESHRLAPRMPLIEALQSRQTLPFIIFFALSTVFTYFSAPTVSWEGHLGGFLAGLLLFRFFDRRNFT